MSIKRNKSNTSNYSVVWCARVFSQVQMSKRIRKQFSESPIVWNTNIHSWSRVTSWFSLTGRYISLAFRQMCGRSYIAIGCRNIELPLDKKKLLVCDGYIIIKHVNQMPTCYVQHRWQETDIKSRLNNKP